MSWAAVLAPQRVSRCENRRSGMEWPYAADAATLPEASDPNFRGVPILEIGTVVADGTTLKKYNSL